MRKPTENLTRNETARLLCCSTKLVDELRRRGDLHSYKIGDRHVIISRKSVDQYLARRRAS